VPPPIDALPADAEPKADGAAAAKDKPKTEAEIEAEAEKERQKAVDDWRAKLDEARKQEQQYKDLIDRIQSDLNDTSSLYTAGRARKQSTQDEAKQKLAEVQARIADLEEQGRRAGYR
jgi:chromosome segregation ATPase